MELQEQLEALGALLAKAITTNAGIAPLGPMTQRPLHIAPADYEALGKLCIGAMCDAGYKIITPGGGVLKRK